MDKGISFDELRQAIRDLAAGNTPPAFGIGDPVSVEIVVQPDQSRFVVIGERGKTPPLHLEPLPMTFLVYLAEERRSGGTNYVKRTSKGMVPAHMSVWTSIVKQVGSSARGLDARGALRGAARWAARINGVVAAFLGESSKRLVIGRQKRGSRETYSLNPDVAGVQIYWPPDFGLPRIQKHPDRSTIGANLIERAVETVSEMKGD